MLTTTVRTDTLVISDDGPVEVLASFKHYRDEDGLNIELTSVEVGFKGGKGIEVLQLLDTKQIHNIEQEIEYIL